MVEIINIYVGRINKKSNNMANEIETISYINLGDGKNHPIDAVTLGGKAATEFQDKSMLVTSINSSSDDNHYPSAKCVYNEIGLIEARLKAI